MYSLPLITHDKYISYIYIHIFNYTTVYILLQYLLIKLEYHTFL